MRPPRRVRRRGCNVVAGRGWNARARAAARAIGPAGRRRQAAGSTQTAVAGARQRRCAASSASDAACGAGMQRAASKTPHRLSHTGVCGGAVHLWRRRQRERPGRSPPRPRQTRDAMCRRFNRRWRLQKGACVPFAAVSSAMRAPGVWPPPRTATATGLVADAAQTPAARPAMVHFLHRRPLMAVMRVKRTAVAAAPACSPAANVPPPAPRAGTGASRRRARPMWRQILAWRYRVPARRGERRGGRKVWATVNLARAPAGARRRARP